MHIQSTVDGELEGHVLVMVSWVWGLDEVYQVLDHDT